MLWILPGTVFWLKIILKVDLLTCLNLMLSIVLLLINTYNAVVPYRNNFLNEIVFWIISSLMSQEHLFFFDMYNMYNLSKIYWTNTFRNSSFFLIKAQYRLITDLESIHSLIIPTTDHYDKRVNYLIWLNVLTPQPVNHTFSSLFSGCSGF